MNKPNKKTTMKTLKNITLILALSAVAFNSNAQEDDAEDRIRLGIKAGVNYSNIYDERSNDYVADGKLGFVGGAFMSIPIGKFIGLQPEFLLSQKGFMATGSVLGFNYELTRTTTYMDVPLMISLRPVPFLSFVAGPQYSYLINQKDVFESSLGGYEVEQEFDNDNIRKNILGVVGGVDINISHFVLSSRMGWDIMTNRGDGSSSTPRYKNVWFQATVGLRL